MKKLNLILLILFIALAAALNFMPHINYPYPMHVDEWVHFQYANHLSNNAPLYFDESYNNLEAGFHFILAVTNSIGIDYLFMFNYFPMIITILICLGVFILARRLYNETAGVFSVLFIAILKSSVMILGPVFLVPLAIGMFLIAAGLFLVKINSKAWILIFAAILIIHPPSALAFFLLINIEFIYLKIRKKEKYIKNILLQFISFIIAFPMYSGIFFNKGLNTIENLKFEPIPGLIFIPRYLGWIVVAFILIGIYFSAEKKKYSAIIWSLGLLIFIFIFYNFKIEVFIPYARALMYLFLVFSLLFGIGIERIINLSKNRYIRFAFIFKSGFNTPQLAAADLKRQEISICTEGKKISDKYPTACCGDRKFLGISFIVILTSIVLYYSLPLKIDSNNYFYHIIDEKNFKDLIFLKENTNKSGIVLTDSWIANSLTPISERIVYSRIVQGYNEIYELKNKKIDEFFTQNCTNTSFLLENNISIVYDSMNKCKSIDGFKLIGNGIFVS